MRPFSNLANVVTTRTYARKTITGLESFYPDMVDRVIGGNVRGHNVGENEIQRLRYYLSERLAGPAGRGWWMSGTEAQFKLGGAALVNCWAMASDCWENWVTAQDLLMLGGGVGWSVESKYVEKLPEVKENVFIHHKLTKDADFIVPDSREGWCELTRRVLESYFVTGKSFSYSTVCIRSAGEPINGFGGVASGPRALVVMVEKICAILCSRQGIKLRPIDSADVTCCIGEMVVSGNVRRAAIIILGDASNKNFLKAKRWDLGSIPTQRAMANFSVVADDVDHDLRPLFWETYKQGEPFGIVNVSNIQKYGRMGELKKDTANCVNPCQPGWATLKTPNGEYTMGEANIGDTIWSGKRWTKIINKQKTGIKPVFSYITKGGVFIGTENHKVVSKGVKIEVCKVNSIDDCEGNTHQIDSVIFNQIEPVYSITVDDPDHTYWTGGLLVGNCGEATLEIGRSFPGITGSSTEPCNLTEINLGAIEDPAEFEEAARLMHRWSKRVTCEQYHWPQADEVIKRNRRVGTGITGCVQNTKLFNPEMLDRIYAAIQDENVKYSKELNIPPSIRTTVIKPSGTWSKMMDCACEGIHPAYSRFFIQRIRLSSNDALVGKLREAGHYIEPQVRLDGTYDPSTVVADFYVKTPEGTPCADSGFDTWKQLDAIKMAQKHWADQSISVTVYYKDEEIPMIQDWLRSNLKEIKTVSFLRHSGHGFKQAPKEAITEEQYEKLSAKIKPLDINNVQEGSDLELADCAGGACPVR